jgi:transcriptional regulator GlxA family with amidase domain
MRPAPHRTTRRVAVVAFDGVQVLDVTGPLEVFGRTTRWLREQGATSDAYALEILGLEAGPLRTSSGFAIVADRSFRGPRPAARPLDTLLVAGGSGTDAAARNPRLLAFLRREARRVRRLGSVCTGAFILAAAGLLDGRRAVTHWRYCAALASRFPRVAVEADPIFIEDRGVFTSAGVTAGMDLALAMVEDDHGRHVALEVARELVVFLRRPGGQSQFSAQLRSQTAAREPLRDVQDHILAHPEADASVTACARRAGMSPRHFARVFTREVGVTPAVFVERARIEAARQRLEDTNDGVDAIAAACGFGTSETMRRAFVRALGVAPASYRERFRAA